MADHLVEKGWFVSAAELARQAVSELVGALAEAGRLYIPPAVEAELRSLDPIPEELETVPLGSTFFEEARTWVRAGVLDEGEAHALALAKQLEADWLLTDDAAARLVAGRDGLTRSANTGSAGSRPCANSTGAPATRSAPTSTRASA